MKTLFVLLLLVLFPAWALSEPELLLANRYEPGIDLEDYWVSEKLDGVRAYWNGKALLSRQGNAFQAPAWFTADFPDTPLDGELWMGRQRFAAVAAAVRRSHPDAEEWQRIRFRVFDLPGHDGSFTQRLMAMRALLDPSPSAYLKRIKQRRASNHQALMTRLDRVVAAGGEGLMLHRGNSTYRSGRSDDLLKVKKYQDAEATVVGYSPGKGKYQGMLGALVVERPDGRRFKLGTGFTDAQRAQPPAMGATVTYRYVGLTSTGLPRFASFLRVRRSAVQQ